MRGDSFRRGRFRRVSGGPFFSALPEKKGEKRGARTRLVPAAGAVQVGTNFSVVASTYTHPTGAILRAACHGTPSLIVVSFE